MLHGYQAVILHSSPVLYFHSNFIVFISTVGFSNEDNCCLSKGIGLYTSVYGIYFLNMPSRDNNFFRSTNKQLLDQVFVISRIIKVEVGVISPSQRLRLITLTVVKHDMITCDLDTIIV